MWRQWRLRHSWRWRKLGVALTQVRRDDVAASCRSTLNSFSNSIFFYLDFDFQLFNYYTILTGRLLLIATGLSGPQLEYLPCLQLAWPSIQLRCLGKQPLLV